MLVIVSRVRSAAQSTVVLSKGVSVADGLVASLVTNEGIAVGSGRGASGGIAHSSNTASVSSSTASGGVVRASSTSTITSVGRVCASRGCLGRVVDTVLGRVGEDLLDLVHDLSKSSKVALVEANTSGVCEG